MTRPSLIVSFSAACLLLGASAGAAPIVFSTSGDAPGDIQAGVDAFRAALGGANNGNTPGQLADGRREINWDGGGSTDTSVVGNPFTGFQNNRGATMTTPGTGFVQAPVEGLATQFGDPSYTGVFEAFSPVRLFVPIDSNVTDITFSIPGTSGGVAATVSAFGAVFSDVDSDATTLELFGPGDVSLGAPFPVPSLTGDGTLSFLGVLFDAGEQIARVRVTTGNAALGAPDIVGESDVVAMDDFIYAEPVPEPGTLVLLALGLAGVAAGRRRG
jgi:hypothetical protein